MSRYMPRVLAGLSSLCFRLLLGFGRDRLLRLRWRSLLSVADNTKVCRISATSDLCSSLSASTVIVLSSVGISSFLDQPNVGVHLRRFVHKLTYFHAGSAGEYSPTQQSDLLQSYDLLHPARGIEAL